ncbi:NUDIX domain-containing protein [Pseudoroseicyclus aestuarii]|uniref:ADP-ribose pyrophosphatase n=1 Tax=Pseudoroseicyclus aestuarii TaxID=1795041 RepID=A0A318SUD4_9RHOB|nr:NUDIX domain-containing protein [Pseudoroseicyclus aestuarii]PYE85510.1 nudix-type nucleoside diphosphatase (YffH/AdpP family) [Pseudoroseicyclus aestuarii]
MIFLYGPLRHLPLAETLLAEALPGAQEAVLPGYALLQSEGYPALQPDPQAAVEGLLLEPGPAALARLEAYLEGLDLSPAQAVLRLPDGSEREAALWSRPPSGPGAQPFSRAQWLADDAPRALREAAELAGHAPPLEPALQRRQAVMRSGRAEAGLRAARETAPATCRLSPPAGAFALGHAEPLTGGFFKYDRMVAAHRRFDGGREEGLLREVFVGVDAALVLPWDRARDRVLLVEQFRTGPARRGDPNPWCLEPVAGIVDPGEEPAEAARREALEEARLTLTGLELMFHSYASPGNSTDHYYCYLGHADLPDDDSYSGGLAEEAEDLRLHVLPLDEAVALIGTGEINVTPTIAMLLWLQRHRDTAAG